MDLFLAGLNDIGVKLYILLWPQIELDYIDRTIFLTNNIYFSGTGIKLYFYIQYASNYVYILNLFVLVWIHSSRHLITIQLTTMHFEQLLNFSILSVCMHGCVATSKHIAITVNVWGLNEYSERYKSIYFWQSAIYPLAGLWYWCPAPLAWFSLNWRRLSRANKWEWEIWLINGLCSLSGETSCNVDNVSPLTCQNWRSRIGWYNLRWITFTARAYNYNFNYTWPSSLTESNHWNV